MDVLKLNVTVRLRQEKMAGYNTVCNAMISNLAPFSGVYLVFDEMLVLCVCGGEISGIEKVPQRTLATKISPNFRVNFLVRFASNPSFIG